MFAHYRVEAKIIYMEEFYHLTMQQLKMAYCKTYIIKSCHLMRAIWEPILEIFIKNFKPIFFLNNQDIEKKKRSKSHVEKVSKQIIWFDFLELVT